MFFLVLDLMSAPLADPERTAVHDSGWWCFSYWPLSKGEMQRILIYGQIFAWECRLTASGQ